jgi:drug/metabolite transporter (DMT)-like permease
LFKIALDELPVLTFRAIVLLTAILTLLVILLVRGELRRPQGQVAGADRGVGDEPLRLEHRDVVAVLYIPSGHASVLAYTMPLWVALIGFVVFGQRLPRRLLASILIGSAAVVSLMVPNFASYAHAPAGLFWGLFAGFCWAVGTFIVKRTSWQGMGLSLTFWQVVITLPPILLGAVMFDGLPTHWPSTQALVATIYTGAVPMALGTAAWFALVKLLPAQVAGLAAIAIPIVAIVSGVLILHEPLSVLQAIAIASTVLALWLALMPAR